MARGPEPEGGDVVPRYYFDTDDGSSFSHDTKGIECQSLDDVRRAALAALPDMALEVIPDGSEVELSVSVRDVENRTILLARLTLSVMWAERVG